MKTLKHVLSLALVIAPLFVAGQGNPYLMKYAGAYHLLREGEQEATDQTEKLNFSPDGRCTSTSPFYNEDGSIGKTPIILAGTWKAGEGLIQMYFKEHKEDAEARLTEFRLEDGVFRGGYSYLKKVVPPGHYLTLYSGTYNMLADGQTADSKTDRYVFTPDGKCTWTIFTTVNPDGSVSNIPVKKSGTWKAKEGLIQMYFDVSEGGNHGGELLTDFRLSDGVFRAESVFLKRVVTKAPIKK